MPEKITRFSGSRSQEEEYGSEEKQLSKIDHPLSHPDRGGGGSSHGIFDLPRGNVSDWCAEGEKVQYVTVFVSGGDGWGKENHRLGTDSAGCPADRFFAVFSAGGGRQGGRVP